LISGYLDDARLARALGEILDIGAATEANRKLVVVFESEGGSLPALLDFLECVLADEPTRALIEGADVKIYQAFSAAALLAFWMGGRREMAAGTRIGFHLPLLTLKSWQVDREGRRIAAHIVEHCRRYEMLLADLMKRLGLDEPRFKAELYSSGWLYVSVEDALGRGLVHEIF
jgi:hypothetical protein